MIGVLIPVFNREQFIAEAIISVLWQTTQDFHIFIYDDGSTDRTLDIVRSLQKGYPDKITYIYSSENKGVAHARNRLFYHVKSIPEITHLVWQDSDDISNLNRLQKLMANIGNNDIVFSAMYFYNHPSLFFQTRTINRVDISKYTSREGLSNNMNFATALFKKELALFPYDETLQRKEDVKWLTNLIEKNIKFTYINEPLYYCRRHDGRLTPQKG